jgi:heme-degrading monooxygenase HmoA
MKKLHSQQMEEDGGPVIVINKFNVNPEEIDEFLKIFAESDGIWKKLRGFISTQLHRGTAGSSVFVNDLFQFMISCCSIWKRIE